MYLKEYRLDTADFDYAAAYANAPQWRKEKADRLRSDRDKKQSIGVWTLLAQGLGDIGIDISESLFVQAGSYFSPGAAGPVFALSAAGKPFLVNYPDVHFSLSHSEERAFCVISDRPVGCDVQKMADISSFEKDYAAIARRFFSQEETENIFRLPDDASRSSMFIRLWALKESYVKMLGEGINMPFDSFTICIKEGISVSASARKHSGRLTMIPTDCDFREYDYSDGYRYAACVSKRE